jgi:hypothetical protein
MTVHVFTCSRKKCRAAYSVSEEDAHLSLLKSGTRCPVEECTGKLRETMSTNVKTITGVTAISALELYQATRGAGLPKEKRCSPEAMKKILVGAKITAVHLDKAPVEERSILFSLTLSNKKVVHLATSSLGATIYKVTDHGTGNHR